MDQYYRIGDLTVHMNPSGRTRIQAEPYHCEPVEQPDITIMCKGEYLKEKYPYMDEDLCEYTYTGSTFYMHLLVHDGLMVHSSAVVMDGRAYLFSAPSGTGKSTHTQLWLRQFGDRAAILNDDKPALRRINGQWYAYGTPWSGKTDLNLPMGVPLAGICLIGRGEENTIERITGTKALPLLMNETIRPKRKDLAARLLGHLDKLLSEVPVWKMKCNMDPQAALVSYEAMSGERKDV